ncbi:M protein repeat protein [Colletotrichum truncatum]|uniref:M protein repeat protein n=1 Tax=Colletotrichum truncatum TaxID=5467 RepID=A0ACC3YXN7_COLTU|nr:M protein repeat protein [Colletotrichum truncatum]KAF6792385.1 M protein repeat protein [Colletotrichum truncatum]
MAAPAKSSRWGSFLQQAVAGVEARLDNILAEGENGHNQQTSQIPPRPITPAKEPTQQIGPARSSTSSRTNDRLQERLAKAMASKTAHSSDNSIVTSDSHIRLSVDGGHPDAATPRNDDASTENTTSDVLSAPAAVTDTVTETNTSNNSQTKITSARQSQDSQRRMSTITILHETANDPQKPSPIRSSSKAPDPSPISASINGVAVEPNDGCSQCDALRTQIEALEVRSQQAAKDQQQEIHRHVEQFEALQVKVQYLARDATDAARKSAAAAPAGSLERKLAEKDEKIVLLMEEGRNLAATEQKHRSIIRKLRSQIAGDEKALDDLRARYERAMADLEPLHARATRVEELEQRNQELQFRFNGMQDELNALQAEAAADKFTIANLREELRKATDQANSAVIKANEETLAAQKLRVRELEETVASLQVEKSLVAERAKANIAEAEEKASRAAERTRVMEIEMKAEIQAMEGKLEAMRALAEEASSGAIGDSQAKLLRQVETLQTQHAIASENWQGIEASLLARLGNLERERDDALRRESDMRKKARETATRCKRQDEELQELTSKFPNYQRDIEAYKSRIEALQKQAESAETALIHTKAELEKQQMAWKAEKTESDRRPWLDDHLAGSISRIQSRPDSPLLSIPTRTMSNDLLLLQSASGKGRQISNPTSGVDAFQEGSSPGRRLSSQTPVRPSVLLGTSSLPGATTLTSFDLPPDSLPTPTSHVVEKDDLFDGVETTSSPRQIMQDMVSVSTVAAGPSVQLVERMSAAIRRLEAEKVTSREELARISGQRDEARAELVALMKDLESGKTASKRVTELEAQVEDINSRYQTTLELLGEKSELVEELRADVQDVKAMYRDLVERTVR